MRRFKFGGKPYEGEREELIQGDHGAGVVNKVADLLGIWKPTFREKVEGRPECHFRTLTNILMQGGGYMM